ncbi:MAG TPA: hypothetical protein VMX97_09520, partial [Hyphomicrobiaceae bacterium]|nr:hypothetical protein [Hyphomicrobiaceae bacterium]
MNGNCHNSGVGARKADGPAASDACVAVAAEPEPDPPPGLFVDIVIEDDGWAAIGSPDDLVARLAQLAALEIQLPDERFEAALALNT